MNSYLFKACKKVENFTVKNVRKTRLRYKVTDGKFKQQEQ
jgi:hypothetical protein